MQRFLLDDLIDWARRRDHKPLIVRGARQVGKSHLVHMLADTTFDHFLEIDFEADIDAASLFASKTPARIIPLLEARYGVPVRPGKTLVFLDEIQAAPKVLATLRYFHEKAPDLHVVAAGSLLDFVLKDHDFSMPVGRIEYAHLGPMTFEEYLLANDKAGLRDFIVDYTLADEVPTSIHEELLRLTREYMVVGGMPAGVASWVDTHDHRAGDAIRQGLLSTFRDDFAKYGSRASHHRLEKLFQSIPMLVGQKFKYSHVDREERARDLKIALDLLTLARVVHRVHHTAANGIPLRAEADDRAFKMLFLDIGLLGKSCGLDAVDLATTDDLLLVNSGAVVEQFVGQHLLDDRPYYDEPELHYWARQKASAAAEVDYVVSIGSDVVPVEVKAGSTGALRSLHLFLRDKQRAFGLRFNSDLPSLYDGKTGLTDGGEIAFRLLSLPLYIVGQTRRLCRENLRAEGG